MDNIREKLTGCFLLVFPQLDRSRVESTSVDNVKQWDSVAQVNLLTVIGEEFGLEIDYEEFEGATSFGALAARLSQLTQVK
jgi:acyl carrier protein